MYEVNVWGQSSTGKLSTLYTIENIQSRAINICMENGLTSSIICQDLALMPKRTSNKQIWNNKSSFFKWNLLKVPVFLSTRTWSIPWSWCSCVDCWRSIWISSSGSACGESVRLVACRHRGGGRNPYQRDCEGCSPWSDLQQKIQISGNSKICVCLSVSWHVGVMMKIEIHTRYL